MPDLNDFGEALMGVGGGPASFEGVQIAPVGGACVWLNNDWAIYSAGDRLEAYNVRTKQRNVIPGSTGANELAAGSGEFLAWLAGRGLYGSIVDPKAGMSPTGTDGRGEISKTGVLSFVRDRQGGPPTILRSKDVNDQKKDVEIHDATYGLCIVGPDKAIWDSGNLNFPCKLLPNARGIRVSGNQVVYWCDKGLVTHPRDSFIGSIVESLPRAFHHRISGDIIAYSTGVGEHPHELVKKKVSELPKTDLEAQPIQEVNVRPLPKKTWIAPFYSHSERYGDTPMPNHVGNAILIGTEEIERIKGIAIPIITSPNPNHPLPDHFVNLVIAYWVNGQTLEELDSEVRRALALPAEKPVVAYLDSDQWPENKPGFLTQRVWPSLQAYRMPEPRLEPLQDFKVRIERALDKISQYSEYIFLTPRFDDSNGKSTIANNLECMPLYDEWMQKYPIVGFNPFSDRRGNAISKNKSLYDWAMGFVQANVLGRPNRFDYWLPDNADLNTILNNKLQQTTNIIVLSKKEKDYLLEKINHTCPVSEEHPEPENLREEVLRVRGKYSQHPSDPELGKILSEVAFEENKRMGFKGDEGPWGLSVKPNGNKIPYPGGGDIWIAYDILSYKWKYKRETLFGCFTDHDGQLVVNWDEADYHDDPNGRPWIKPVRI